MSSFPVKAASVAAQQHRATISPVTPMPFAARTAAVPSSVDAFGRSGTLVETPRALARRADVAGGDASTDIAIAQPQAGFLFGAASRLATGYVEGGYAGSLRVGGFLVGCISAPLTFVREKVLGQHRVAIDLFMSEGITGYRYEGFGVRAMNYIESGVLVGAALPAVLIGAVVIGPVVALCCVGDYVVKTLRGTPQPQE